MVDLRLFLVIGGISDRRGSEMHKDNALVRSRDRRIGHRHADDRSSLSKASSRRHGSGGIIQRSALGKPK